MHHEIWVYYGKLCGSRGESGGIYAFDRETENGNNDRNTERNFLFDAACRY